MFSYNKAKIFPDSLTSDSLKRLKMDQRLLLISKLGRLVYSVTDIQIVLLHLKMSCVMRKPTFCIFANKDADQLRGNPEADQRLCFRYMDSTIPLLPKSEISSL